MSAERYAFAQSVARRAGALANEYFRDRERLTVELKGPQDFVSHADRDVEALLRREISAAFPDDAFLGEETAASFTGALERCWIVDPIDGGANFAHGYPHYAVTIALTHGTEITHAAVLDPLKAGGQRSAIATNARTGSPMYSLSGRMSRLSACCSMTCAVQPAIRLTAKTGVNRSVGMPRA